METVNIFIASSSELHEQRVRIGDCIRRLSYDYSPRGVRIRLLCWEDFHPEYSGISKQDEYDQQLINNCNIFIALFKTVCGKYTQHEVKLALSMNKECHIFQFQSTEEHKELDDYLSEIPVSPTTVDDASLNNDISDIINKYISAHNIKLSSVATPLKTWRLYITLPDDLNDLRIPISNAVRSLEENLEESLGNYFTLYPYRTPDNITSSEHYICFIKEIWSRDDESEVEKAYLACKEPNASKSALLYHLKGHSGIRNNKLAIKINSEYEGFSKRYYTSIDTLKFDLTYWALRHKMDIAMDICQAFTIEGEILYCYGRPFFNINNCPELHAELSVIKRSLAGINKKIQKNIKAGKVTDENLACQLADKRKKIERQLNSTINNWYNKTQMLGSLHLNNADSPLQILKSEQYTQYKELAHKIRVQTSNCENSDVQFLKSFAEQLLEWEKLAYVNLSLNQIHVSEYISVLTHIVQVNDTFFHPVGIDYIEDAIYRKIIYCADQNNYHTLFTEVIRVNYANSFTKDLDLKDAGEYYKEACENILKIDDDSVIAHRYKSFVIKSLLCHYFETDKKQAVFDLGKKYEKLIHKWQTINPNTNYDVDLARCYSFVLGTAPKYYGVCKDLAEQSEILFEKLQSQFANGPFNEDFFDAICYFSNAISTYYIDRYAPGNDEYFNKAMYYISESKKSLDALYPYEPWIKLGPMSQPYHNRGFLYSKAGDWKKAISNYKAALKRREEAYQHSGEDRDLEDIAQTLVNLGSAYLHQNKLNKALEYANRAVNIYEPQREKDMQIFDMLYYEAYQLKATILRDIDIQNGKYPQEALAMMKECMDWSDNHPGNDYEDRFNGVSGIILKQYNLTD